MAVTIITLTNPKLMVADTEAGLTTGTAVECQVTSARVTVDQQFNTIASTGCKGPTQSPAAASFALDLGWFDDWGVTPTGLSQFAWDNKGLPVWWELTPDAVNMPLVKVTGNSYAVPGGIGGTFGDGSASESTATWPCIDEPTIATAVAAAADGTPDVVA